MANTSATGGYLQPTNTATAPLEGDALFDFIQAWIVGITGLPGQYVRPRWQPDPPNIPQTGTDWAAFGITNRVVQLANAELHYKAVGLTPGYDEIRNHEELTVTVSFYGQNADNYAALLREGMGLAQNREPLFVQNMAVVDWGSVVAVPELIKEKWLYRVDFEFRLRRQIVRDYAVLDLASGVVQVNNEHYVETINV